MAYNEMIRLTGKIGAVYEFAIGARRSWRI
jgi:hypothetical protein